MTRTADILSAVKAVGIKLVPEGDGIRATPRAALTDALRASIKANRAAILKALHEEEEAEREAREERAAILEFDAGNPRSEAERIAGITFNAWKG